LLEGDKLDGCVGDGEELAWDCATPECLCFVFGSEGERGGGGWGGLGWGFELWRFEGIVEVDTYSDAFFFNDGDECLM